MGKEKNKKISLTNIKIVYLLCASVVLLALSLFNISLYLTDWKPNTKSKVLGSQNTNLKEEAYWKSFLEENPQYLEGWIELAKIEYYLGNVDEARKAIFKASQIDPNSPDLKEVRRLITSTNTGK